MEQIPNLLKPWRHSASITPACARCLSMTCVPSATPKSFLLVLPAGKSAHIEAGIAYGLGKRCYAVGPYDTTDTLYHIFEKIFRDENELKAFLADVSRPC